MQECQHTKTQERSGERGLWCCVCGVKVYDVDERQCKDCAHSRNSLYRMVCRKHLMSISPDMNVMFKVVDGSCWEPKP